MRLARFVSGLFASLFFLQTSEAWEYRAIRDVQVQCTNGMTCTLSLAEIGEESSGFRFQLERAAGEGARTELLVYTPKPLSSDSDVVISAEGETAAVVPQKEFSSEEDGWIWRLGNKKVIAEVLDAMRSGTRLALETTSENGKTSVDFSLSGVVAGLIFMDEVQGRLETPDALHVKGNRETKPLQAREIKTVDSVPAAIKPMFEGGGECSFFDPKRMERAGGFEVQLSDGDGFLVVLPCAEGGAYNQPYVLFSRYGSEVWPVPVPLMSVDGPTADRIIWNVDYKHSKRELTGFFKGRGIGDCGNFDRWKIGNGPSGARLVLAESRAKGDCDGEYDGGPQNWPRYWPSPESAKK